MNEESVNIATLPPETAPTADAELEELFGTLLGSSYQKSPVESFPSVMHPPPLRRCTNSDTPATIHPVVDNVDENGSDLLHTVDSTTLPPFTDELPDLSLHLETLSDSGIPCDIEQSITELMQTTGPRFPSMKVRFHTPEVKDMYEGDSVQYKSDSGWDLRFTEDITVPPGETVKCDFGVSICAHDEEGEPSAVFMMPRSSIVKTPLRMSNSIGLIDSSYRGTLKAYVDNIKTKPHCIKKGDRLFQLVAPSARPFAVQFVDELPVSERGENGFGSTGV